MLVEVGFNEIDCDCTDEIVCPYCGYEHSDSHEYFSNWGTEAVIDCDNCDKKFKVSAEYSVDYWSSKVPCLNDEGDHNWTNWLGYADKKKSRRCRACGKVEYMDIDEMFVNNS